MTDTLAAIHGWITQVQSQMASVPAQMDDVAPTGDFASVLARVDSVLTAGPSAATASATDAATPDAAGTSLSSVTSTSARAPYGTAATVGRGSTALAGSAGLSGSSAGDAVVSEAERFVGTPYVWGGTTPAGFDCSGLVQYVYGQLGVDLPRTSEQQATAGTAVPSLADAQPGDLVFFAGSDGTTTSPGHVGIYVGHGEMIDAPYTGADVRIEPVGTPVAIRRVLPPTTAGANGLGANGLGANGLGANGLGVAGLGVAGLGVAGLGVTGLATTAGLAGTAAAANAGAGAAVGAAGSGVPATLAPLFVQAAGQYGVPVTLLTAVAKHESDFEPNAVSSADAEGIMQIMPGTAAGLGINPFDPAQAIDGAAQLLSGYMTQFGSIPLALAAYDAGAGAVEEYGGIPPYAETQNYVTAIMQAIGGTA